MKRIRNEITDNNREVFESRHCNDKLTTSMKPRHQH